MQDVNPDVLDFEIIISSYSIILLVSQLAVQCCAAFPVLKYTWSVVIPVKGEYMGFYRALD